jgi:hypothetical protein
MESTMRAQKPPKRPRPEPKPEAESGPHYVADEPVGEADSLGATVQSPTTDTGLSVEQQIRKEWDPKKQGGLPMPLKTGRR